MVSGRYFFPNAPLLCLKRIPACAVTSVKLIGPEGRSSLFSAGSSKAGDGIGAAGVDAGPALWAVGTVSGGLDDFCRHPTNIKTAAVTRQAWTGSRRLKSSVLLCSMGRHQLRRTRAPRIQPH